MTQAVMSERSWSKPRFTLCLSIRAKGVWCASFMAFSRYVVIQVVFHFTAFLRTAPSAIETTIASKKPMFFDMVRLREHDHPSDAEQWQARNKSQQQPLKQSVTKFVEWLIASCKFNLRERKTFNSREKSVAKRQVWVTADVLCFKEVSGVPAFMYTNTFQLKYHW